MCKPQRFGFGQDEFLYDLGDPADGRNYRAGCDDAFVAAVKATDLNITFLILILSCLAVLLLVICILIVYRRKKHVYSDKDIDCDIRENIINYEDEGGGEGNDFNRVYGIWFNAMLLLPRTTGHVRSGTRA